MGIIAGCLGGEDPDERRSSDDQQEPAETEDSEESIEDDEVEFTDNVFINTAAAGGGFDAYSRLLAPHLGNHLPGNPEVLVENIPLISVVGSLTETYRSDPDGHTMSFAYPFTPIIHDIGRDVDFDLREMSHIGSLVRAPNAWVVMEDAGVEDWNDFVDNIEDLNIAGMGPGSWAHINMAVFAEMTGEFDFDDLTFVHFDGTGPVLSGLERGEVNAFPVTDTTSGAQVELAIDGAELFVVFSEPEVTEDFLDGVGVTPTVYSSELDVPNIEEFAELSVFNRFLTGPPDVPDEIVDAQRNAFSNLIEDEEYLEETAEGGRPVLNSGDHHDVSQLIDDVYDAMDTETIRTIIHEALGS